MSHAGTVLLLRTAEKTGLTTALSTGLAPWRKPLASHDPGKIVLDLAVTLALGGDCLADIAQLRNHPEGLRPGSLRPGRLTPGRRRPESTRSDQHRTPHRSGPRLGGGRRT